MSRPVDPRTGQLLDYLPRRGDAPITVRQRNDSGQQKWGGRFLLSDDPALNAQGIGRKKTLIATGDLLIPTPINLQIRFANNVADTQQPIVPFVYPVTGGFTLVHVTVRRSNDPTASLTTDEYDLLVNDTLPIDTITTRQLGVDVEVTGAAPGSTGWVEAIATPVADIGPTNKVYPYQMTRAPTFTAVSVAPVSLLAANSDRAQFFITNTSTVADLLIQFGLGSPGFALPTWGPPPLGTLILPRGTFAVYESMTPFTFRGKPGIAPLPLRGTIYGVWSAPDAAPGAGAMIHEGTVF